MAWYPAAKKLELQPESDNQPAIRPTQFLLHSIVAPWTPERTYEYWRDSTNLESHFGLGYDGSLGQFIGTETRADATGAANRRADGSGAVSLESASNLQASDRWTDEQVESIIRLGVWLHQTHSIPLRICRTPDDPGFGYHRLFNAWNPDAHSCPGPARVTQFHNVVFPGIVARAKGTTTPTTPSTEDDMPTPADVWKADVIPATAPPYNNSDYAKNKTWSPSYALGSAVLTGRRTEAKVDALTKQLAATTAAITALAKLVGSGVDTAAVVAAVKAAATDAIEHAVIDVNINTKES